MSKPAVRLIPGTTVRHKGVPCMLATPDYIAVDEDGKPLYILECKTAGFPMRSEFGEPGTDQIMPRYRYQCQHQMEVLDIDLTILAVLIGGNDYREYEIKRNREFGAMLAEIEGEVWSYVEKGELPPANGSEAAMKVIAREAQDPAAVYLPVTHELDEKVAQYRQVSGEIEELETKQKKLEVELAEAIGAHKGLTGSWGKVALVRVKGGESVSWKDLAKSLKPTKEQIAAFTKTKAPYAYLKDYFD